MFSQIGGIATILSFLLLFSIFSFGISWFLARFYGRSKDEFLVANRQLNAWEGSFSIAASWIWAPALFISALQAYTQGWVGFFWFAVPNFLALLLFAVLVSKLINRFPQGFTLSEYMGKLYGNRVQNIYWVSLIGLTVGAFATQLLAGAKFISIVSDIDFVWSSIILALIPLTYSLFFGLKSSVVTDYTKVVFLLLIGIGLVAACIAVTDPGIILKGLNGINGDYTSLFNDKGWLVFLTFGLPSAISLLSGPFGDQAFWQRAFAMQRQHLTKSFVWGAVIFISVPILMAILGFIAAGIGLTGKDRQFINLFLVLELLPIWTIIPFTFMVLAGITSILDSKLCAVSSIAAQDFVQRFSKKTGDGVSLYFGKVSMVALTVIALLIANIPGLQIVHLFLIYGALRASSFLPTLMTMLGVRLNRQGVFWGIMVSLIVGLPVFAYGLLNSQVAISVTGSLLGVLGSGLIAIVWTWLGSEEDRPTTMDLRTA
jgi:Na+/proline symporter